MPTLTTTKDFVTVSIPQFAIFFNAYRECTPDIQAIVNEAMATCSDPDADADDKEIAAQVVIESLFPSLMMDLISEDNKLSETEDYQSTALELDHEEQTFSERLRDLMNEKSMTQEELGALTGVGQPAIANLLSRCCRPQRKTITKLANALGISEGDLWPSP